jgi:hypothetical protein
MRYYNTEVGLLAVWDSKALSDITEKSYFKVFVENRTMVKLMNSGKAIVWGTGGDGGFNIVVRQGGLTNEEEKMVEMKIEDLKLFVSSGEIFIGTPECAGLEKKYLAENVISKQEIANGNYSADIYFLCNKKTGQASKETPKNNENNPEIIDFGYIVLLRKALDDYDFPVIKKFPQFR